MGSPAPTIAIVHDYLTQRGGAERVVIVLARAFPGAAIYTSLYDSAGTFPEFRDLDIRTTILNRLPIFRRRHRFALPFLAPAFSHLSIDADLVVCSSSGWAHGSRTRGRKIVYCHAPARWLYQPDRYMTRRVSVAGLLLRLLRPALLGWDRRAAASADRYLANSTAVSAQLRRTYGIEAHVLHPPPALDGRAGSAPDDDIALGFFLCVSRLLAYKNVDAVVAAFAEIPDRELVVVGDGPELNALRRAAPANVRFVGTISDDSLCALYAGCVGLVAPAYEDFGLTPLEAATFGKPTAALRFGGYLDTVVEDRTGVFFDDPTPAAIAHAIHELVERRWDESAIRAHAAEFSAARFVEQIRLIVADELSAARAGHR